MTTPHFANRQTLQAQIGSFDIQIDRIIKMVNAVSFKTGSLMLSGRSGLGKDFNEIITWRDNVPLPKIELKNFLQHYCNHLIYLRNNCVAILESEETSFLDQTRISHCNGCCRQTLQRNYFIISGNAGIAIPAPEHTWICNECESIIKDHQPGPDHVGS